LLKIVVEIIAVAATIAAITTAMTMAVTTETAVAKTVADGIAMSPETAVMDHGQMETVTRDAMTPIVRDLEVDAPVAGPIMTAAMGLTAETIAMDAADGRTTMMDATITIDQVPVVVGQITMVVMMIAMIMVVGMIMIATMLMVGRISLIIHRWFRLFTILHRSFSRQHHQLRLQANGSPV
jgi:hypothetical protein